MSTPNAKPCMVVRANVRVPSSRAPERLRIWQLDVGRHCSVLGTCLSLQDLHALARKARCRIDPATSAYVLHSWFVDMVLYENALSKLVDKELEKQHAKAAYFVRCAQTEPEIEARWKEVTASGRIAGAYWGAMSHPLCSEELQWRLFGEIHMLSHLVGSSRRSDLARVHDLEGTCASLDGKLAQLKHDHRASLKERKRLEDEVTARRRDGELSTLRLTNAQRRIAALERETLADAFEARIAELERELREERDRAIAAELALSGSETLNDELREAEARATEQVRDLLAENEALESELTAGRICPFASSPDSPGALGSSGSPDGDDLAEVGGLCGKRILCVGGRTNLVQHYRALVERHGGEFLHHDGGLEDSLDAVTRAMSTVDAVVCPIDCVSHAACLKVKRACKHLAKAFVVLRSSGLSSFARGIRMLAAPAPALTPT